MRALSVKAVVVLLSIMVVAGVAQARGGRGGGPTVYKGRVDAHWFANNTRFWYRNDLAGGAREFVLVVVDGNPARQAAFDHGRLAGGLSKARDANIAADHLPFDAIEYLDNGKAVRFTVDGTSYRCDLSTYECVKSEGAPVTGQAMGPMIPEFNMSLALRGMAQQTAVEPGREFLQPEDTVGETAAPDLRERSSVLPPDANPLADLGRLGAGAPLDVEGLSPAPQATQTQPATQTDVSSRGAAGGGRGFGRGGGRGFGRGGGPTTAASPDNKWTAAVQNFNVVLRSTDGKETPLTTDGVQDNRYTGLSWSRDSQALVAFRYAPGSRPGDRDVYMIQSSPAGQNGETGGGVGRAILNTRPYALPGDKFDTYELSVFDVANQKQIKPDVGLVDMSPAGTDPGLPNLNWKSDGIHFTYEKYDRGHQRVRLIEVNSRTGEVRNLVDDVADGKTQKFIWSANRDGIPGLPMFRSLNENEVIYVSEMDGWRHMYLSDARRNPPLKQIDHGEWILRGVDYIDTANRVIWFTCGGAYPEQDRMFIHYGHVKFDGSDQVIYTAGDGTHTIRQAVQRQDGTWDRGDYSPDFKYAIDTYGCADRAPVTELRRVSDGKLICLLEKADVEGTWNHPELFCAKGRDGKTDIWGVISRPANLDPTKKYPIIEDIYAGPQGSNGTLAPIAFGTTPRNPDLLALGFITVKIDAMGSFGGSKAYHDVCWQNLADGGFPDRIAWMKAAAAKYPYMDIERVGIFGTSAGGQNAAAAVLFHPEFYKVAVANSGCHDNRMDKATWNEQWMGYPVGPQYAACSNIDNAYRLKGHLQLVVGELDTNVPPESTYRLVDALVKANKDFEFVMVPGADHGAGSPITNQKRQDFFVRYLMGKEPSNHNLDSGIAVGGPGAGGAGGRRGGGGAGARGAGGRGAGGGRGFGGGGGGVIGGDRAGGAGME